MALPAGENRQGIFTKNGEGSISSCKSRPPVAEGNFDNLGTPQAPPTCLVYSMRPYTGTLYEYSLLYQPEALYDRPKSDRVFTHLPIIFFALECAFLRATMIHTLFPLVLLVICLHFFFVFFLSSITFEPAIKSLSYNNGLEFWRCENNNNTNSNNS